MAENERLLTPSEEYDAKCSARFGNYYWNEYGITTAEHEVAKAQLAKAEPIIRAETLKEAREWLERKTGDSWQGAFSTY